MSILYTKVKRLEKSFIIIIYFTSMFYKCNNLEVYYTKTYRHYSRINVAFL